MIFDIEQIYEEGLDFEVLESKDQFNLDSPDLILMKDVRAQGRLEKSGQSIFCDGSLQTELSATCTRCLGSCSYIVSVKLNIHFIPRVENKISSDEIELTATDVEQEYYEGGQINLSNSVRDLIILSMPQVILCREYCAGLCSKCGLNLNEDKCFCANEGSGDSRLAVLLKLKDKLK
jgi:uncharacterized protein